jgi:peptide/nickel transport system substrate-binding protein
MRTKFLRILSIFLFGALFLAACAQPTPEVVEVEKEVVVTEVVEKEVVVTEMVEVEVEKVVTPTAAPGRQTLIVGIDSAPQTLDTADYSHRQTETVLRNMFDGLVTRDTRSGVHLEIAEEMNWIDDLTLEVKLRQGVTFHDGTELTSDDVVYTYMRIITENAIEFPEPHSSPRKGFVGSLESIEKVDDYTVKMHFGAPFPPYEQLFVHNQIVPMKYLDEVGTQGFVENPIGTGPFKFVSAQPGLTEIVMERYDGYYGGSPDLEPVGEACVQNVVFRVIPEASTRVAALLAGEVDIIQAVPPELVDTLAQTPGVQVKSAPGTRPMWAQLNVSQPPFDDVKVRQALNYAVDKQLIVDAIYGGRAVAIPGPLSPFNNFVNKSLEPYAYDPDLALSLLEEAGFSDSDEDGILDKNGQPFSFTIDTVETYSELSEAVASQLRTLGIDASVRVWEYGVVKPQLYACERSSWLRGWGDSAFDPVGHFEATWHTYEEGVPTYGRGNFGCYSNERVDELIKQGESTADAAERQTIYDEAQQIIYDEAPAIFLILFDAAEAASESVTNWEPASDGRVNLHDVCISSE